MKKRNPTTKPEEEAEEAESRKTHAHIPLFTLNPRRTILGGARPIQINLKDWFCFGPGLVLGQGQTDGTATQAPEGSTALWIVDDSLLTNSQDFPNWHADGV